MALEAKKKKKKISGKVGPQPETWNGARLRNERLAKRLEHHPTPTVSGIQGGDPPSPASRAGTGLPTNVQAVSRAVRHVNTHHPWFQIRARPS